MKNSSQGHWLWNYPMRMPHNLTNEESTVGQVMAWCHQTTSHCLRQFRSMSLYGVTTLKLKRHFDISHDDVIKWKHFPHYWPFVWGIHRSPVNSPHKGQWHGALMFSLICVWINGWVNNHEVGDLRPHRAHHDVTVMHHWLHINNFRCCQRRKYQNDIFISV